MLLTLAALRLAACASTQPPPAPIPQVAPIPPAKPLSHDCEAAGWEAAAATNAASLETLPWAPFGREELGWRVYAPLIAQEIGVACAPQSTGFARALARWEAGHGLPEDGLVSQASFTVFKGVLQARRPILMMSVQGLCPAPADEALLETAGPGEQLGEKAVRLRPGALAAWRRMAAQARADVPEIAADPELLGVFSGYRSPDADAARCASELNCNGHDRASCSPHRTGLAIDLYLGHASGFSADSTAAENRLYIVSQPAYRWMVANAARFGFVNYAFEPWHWEWTGEPPVAPPR